MSLATQIITLVASGESETLECKTSTGTRREIRAGSEFSLSDRQVRRVLEELRDRGLVVSTGRGSSARWKLSI